MSKDLLYDNTFFGFLNCIYEVYIRKQFDIKIYSCKRYKENLLAESEIIETDEKKAFKVISRLKSVSDKQEKIKEKRIKTTVLKNVYLAFLSEIYGIENEILKYIEIVLKHGENTDNFLNCESVIKVNKAAQKVSGESHLFKGILRFQELEDKMLYGKIKPEYNILPLIAGHFKKRYAAEKWVIYDEKRKYILFYDNGKIEAAEMITQNDIENYISSEEEQYQKLWKAYFDKIAIEERKNIKLQMHFIPKKYWLNLTEKIN